MNRFRKLGFISYDGGLEVHSSLLSVVLHDLRTVQTWLELAAISSGPLFRSISRHGQVQPGRLSPIDVARVVKKLAERAGLDAAKYAGHSLRAGHATSAAIAGAVRAVDHEPDRASQRADGEAVYPGREFVPGE
jgi:hypothetical protein